MDLRGKLDARFASQLGRPSGLTGLMVAVLLNRSNGRLISKAVDALALEPGATAADLGFGGGVGLGLMLDRVGSQGRVEGVDLSPTMVGRASRQFRRQVASRRLRLQTGSLTELPIEDGSIQGAITVNTIYFVADLDRVLSELARILARPGRVVVGIGDPQWMASLPVTAHGFRLRPVGEVVSSAKKAGLALEDDQRLSEGTRSAHLLVFST